MRRLACLAIVCATTVLVIPPGAAPGEVSTSSNGRIAFTQTPDGDSTTAFTIDPNGANKMRVGTAGTVECTSWAPDGGKILCDDWSPPRVQPATADPDGSHFTRLNPNLPLDLFCTFWSPSGGRILCHSEGNPDPADAGLWTVRSSDAGARRRVTVSPVGRVDVPNGYSPDGSRVLFSRFHSDEAPGVLFSVSLDGTGTARLTPPGLGVIDFFSIRLGASWSPDSSRVAFAGEDLTTGETALFVENADGTGLHPITPPGMGALSAQWSPDGRMIAFTGCCNRAFFQAWIIHPDGTGLTKPVPAISGSFSRTPVWSPDSRKILFVRNINGARALWIVNVGGSGLFRVTDVPFPIEYSWGATSE